MPAQSVTVQGEMCFSWGRPAIARGPEGQVLLKDHGKGVPGRSDSLPRPGDVRAWHISGRWGVFRNVPFSLGTGPEEGSETKGLPRHQAEGQGLCLGAVWSSRGPGQLWM